MPLKPGKLHKTSQGAVVAFIRLRSANCPLLPRRVLRFYYGSLETCLEDRRPRQFIANFVSS